MSDTPKVSFASACALERMEAELTRLHLAEAGHAELWGAISVAQAALKQCWFIANRDRCGDDTPRAEPDV